MNKLWWRVRMTFWLLRFGYVNNRQVVSAFQWTAAEEWETYRADGYTPKEAILEDASYG